MLRGKTKCTRSECIIYSILYFITNCASTKYPLRCHRFDMSCNLLHTIRERKIWKILLLTPNYALRLLALCCKDEKRISAICSPLQNVSLNFQEIASAKPYILYYCVSLFSFFFALPLSLSRWCVVCTAQAAPVSHKHNFVLCISFLLIKFICFALRICMHIDGKQGYIPMLYMQCR